MARVPYAARAVHRELSRQQEERERLAYVANFTKDKNARLAAAELRVREFDRWSMRRARHCSR